MGKIYREETYSRGVNAVVVSFEGPPALLIEAFDSQGDFQNLAVWG
jgi:hypothetical protein